MSDTIKRIDITEFRERGYLQEANRLFFHPLGLALEITQDEDGSEHLSGVWDYREDPEGITFGGPDDYGLDVAKAEAVEGDRLEHVGARLALFGQSVQPLTNDLDKR
jgi:hypothetical protein